GRRLAFLDFLWFVGGASGTRDPDQGGQQEHRRGQQSEAIPVTQHDAVPPFREKVGLHPRLLWGSISGPARERRSDFRSATGVRYDGCRPAAPFLPGKTTMDLDAKICYCFHVTRRKLANFVRIERPKVASLLSQCGGAGTGCGWCIPFLQQIHQQAVAGG